MSGFIVKVRIHNILTLETAKNDVCVCVCVCSSLIKFAWSIFEKKTVIHIHHSIITVNPPYSVLASFLYTISFPYSRHVYFMHISSPPKILLWLTKFLSYMIVSKMWLIRVQINHIFVNISATEMLDPSTWRQLHGECNCYEAHYKIICHDNENHQRKICIATAGYSEIHCWLC